MKTNKHECHSGGCHHDEEVSIEILPGFKRCTTCKEIIIFSEFSKDRKAKDGLCGSCKDCVRAKMGIKKRKPRNIPDGFKWCRECEEIKKEDEFRVDMRAKGGLHPKCKECVSKYGKKNATRIKEKNSKDPAPTKTHKTCNSCGETKKAENFSIILWVPDKLSSYCKECQSAKAKKCYDDMKMSIKISPESGLKICSNCKVNKKLDEFNKNSSLKDGHANICRECKNSEYSETEKITIDTKHCSDCKELKPIGEFNKNKHSKDGHVGKCRDCAKKDYKEKVDNEKIKYPDGKKYCSDCKTTKLLSDFNGAKKRCRECDYKKFKESGRKSKKKYYIKNKNKVQKQQKRYAKNKKK